MKWLATWIMNSIANDQETEWALAMRREFDEITSNHLSWAIGCYLTQFTSNLQSNIGLALAVIAVHFLAPVVGGLVAAPLYFRGAEALGLFIAFCYAAPWAFVLGIYRPKRVLAITIFGGLLLPLASGYSVASSILNMSFMDYIAGIGATMLVGLNGIGTISMVLLWYVSAAVGARIAHRVRPNASYSASNP